MIGSSSPPLPEAGGGGGCGPPPLDRRLPAPPPPPDIRRFILGSFWCSLVWPSEEQDEEVIGIEADCWMRIFEVGLEVGWWPLVGSG